MPPLADRQTIVTCCSHCGKEFRVRRGTRGQTGQVFPVRPGIHRQPAARFLPRQERLVQQSVRARWPRAKRRPPAGGCGGDNTTPNAGLITAAAASTAAGGRGDRAADGPGDSSVLLGARGEPCPNCGQSIMAAAVRCRHCGATFSSAKTAPSTPASTIASRNCNRNFRACRRLPSGCWSSA